MSSASSTLAESEQRIARICSMSIDGSFVTISSPALSAGSLK